MRILDRYVSREVASHTLLGLAVFTFVFFVPQLVRLMELLVQHAGTTGQETKLFLSSLPPVLVFTLPMAVLVGVLIGLGRLSADSEIVALNASGVSLSRLLMPIGAIALAATACAFVITLWLGPMSLRTLRTLEYHMRASQASFAVQPRVFDERFPHYLLYVQDTGASGTHWRGVLLADVNSSAGSKLTLAKDAIVIADAEQDKLEIHLDDVETHQTHANDPQHYELSASATESMNLPLESNPGNNQGPQQLSLAETSTRNLSAVRGTKRREASVEFQRRLALPTACLIFGLLGVPVGVRPRRGGRAAGFVATILLISGYYMLFVTGIHLAQQGTLAPALGVWSANIITFVTALVLLRRIEKIHPEARWAHWVQRRLPQTSAAKSPAAERPNGLAPLQNQAPRTTKYRTAGFPLIIDLYILRAFFFWLGLMLAAFVILSDAFTLFDLLNDISRNHISLWVVTDYFLHLLPMMVYQLLPLAALVSTLITLGLLAKNNEVTAFKACGISLFRLAMPLLFAGALLTAGMFILDNTYMPYANQRQEALHNEIKGRPAQTFFEPAHEWIFGQHDKVYNYRFFDSDRNLFGGLNVFELDSANFQMRRRIYASRAYWAPHLGSWVLEEGWVRDFSGGTVTGYTPFRVDLLPELTEPPSYFKREVLEYYEMNWRQLGKYIASLRQAGFDTSRLSVEWHKEFAYPLITTIIMFLGISFAFLVGTRGAMGGVALAVGIGIVYWATAALFEALGAVGQLPPVLAGWAPDAIFGFIGLYFFLKMKT